MPQNNNGIKRGGKPNLLMNQDNYGLGERGGDKHVGTEGSVPMSYGNNNMPYTNSVQNGYNKMGNINAPKTSNTGRRPLMGMINFGNAKGGLNNPQYGMNNQRNYNMGLQPVNNMGGYNNRGGMNNKMANHPGIQTVDQNDERPLDKGENLDKTKEKDNPEEGEETFECESCGRRFVKEALEKHYKVCQKVFNEKRAKFDSKKNRILDPEHAIMLKNAEYKEKREARMNKNKDKKPQGDPKWKKQSEEFRSIIKGGGEDGVVKPSVLTEDYTLCQFCNRKYNEDAYKKHLATCERKYKEAQMKAKSNKGKAQNGKKK